MFRGNLSRKAASTVIAAALTITMAGAALPGYIYAEAAGNGEQITATDTRKNPFMSMSVGELLAVDE